MEVKIWHCKQQEHLCVCSLEVDSFLVLLHENRLFFFVRPGRCRHLAGQCDGSLSCCLLPSHLASVSRWRGETSQCACVLHILTKLDGPELQRTKAQTLSRLPPPAAAVLCLNTSWCTTAAETSRASRGSSGCPAPSRASTPQRRAPRPWKPHGASTCL